LVDEILANCVAVFCTKISVQSSCVQIAKFVSETIFSTFAIVVAGTAVKN